MLTQLTVGKFTICDYLTAADGDAQDLDGKVIGTDYFEVDSALKFTSIVDQKVISQGYIEQEGYFLKFDIKTQILTILGYTDDHPTVEAIEEYISRHTDNGNDPEYFFWRRSTTEHDFRKFYKGSTEYEYARGYLKKSIGDWNAPMNTLYKVILTFYVVWSQ